LIGSALALAFALSIITLLGTLTLLFTIADSAATQLTVPYLIFFVPANFIGLTLVAIDQGNQSFVRYNIFRLVPQATYLLSILLLWRMSIIDISTLLLASWLGTFFVCIGRWHLIGAGSLAYPKRDQMTALLRKGLEFHATAFAGVLFQNADRLICVAFFTYAELGIYAVASTISGAGLGIVSSATSIVLFPKLASTQEKAERRYLIRNALGTSCLVALFTNTILALIIPFLLPLLFGTAFRGAVPIAMLLCFAQIPSSFVQITTIALRALDDWRAGPLAQIVALLVFAPCAVCLVPKLDLDGIALSLMVSQATAAGYLLKRLQSNIGIGAVQCVIPETNWIIAQLVSRGTKST
jgi:O-antigen/teichoic acid export membrane protein